MNRAAPPRAAERLLALLLGRHKAAGSILGDLHEEHGRLAARDGRVAAARAHAWYWQQILRIGVRHAFQRLRRRLARTDAPRVLPNPGDSLMTTLAMDLRYAWRGIVARPATSAVMIVTLALGLGTNAAIFGVIDALVLRPFAIPDLGRIAFVTETAPGDGMGTQESVAPANFLDWKRQATVFERLAAFEETNVNLSGVEDPERLLGYDVSADFFPVLGLQPALGRVFLPNEETHGSHRRVVLGHDLWQRRFGGDAAAIGRTILLNAEPFEIVGVAPRGFTFPQGAQLWMPLAMSPETAANRRLRYLNVIGRLAPGRSLDDAGAEMAVIARRLEEQHPDINRGHGALAMTLVDGMKDQGLGPILVLWQSSAAFILLIACANIANLLLARGAERHRDVAVRLALGASRARLVSQMLLESLALAAAAIPLSLAVAAGALHVIRVSLPARIVRFLPGWENMSVDGAALAFTTLLAVAAAVVFGIVPAVQYSRPRLADTLKDGGRGATSGRQRLRRALVVAEVALALPLLVVAALSIAGVNRFLYGPQGYDPNGVLVMRALLPDARYVQPESRRQFTSQALEKLSAIPGVRGAAAINVAPATTTNSIREIHFDGRPHADPLNPPTVDHRLATPTFFATMGVPILKGRGFVEADRDGAQQVAIITPALADRHFPDRDPLGQRVRLTADGPWLTIVGVAGDIVHDWFGRTRRPTLYRPYAQAPSAGIALLVRTGGDPLQLTHAAAQAVRGVDPTQPLFDVMSMRRQLHERTIGLQYVAAIMGAFGLLALMLAVVGVYSVMAGLVAQRTHEIGVRMALGAERGHVFRLTVGQTGRLAAIGLAIGLALSAAAARFVEANLFGAVSNDMRLQAALTVILAAAALIAGYVPARRAASIDPIVALRAE